MTVATPPAPAAAPKTASTGSASQQPARPFTEAANRLPGAPSKHLEQTVPGERGAPLVGHTIEFVRDTKGLVDRMREAHGSKLRLQLFGYPVLLIGDPDAAKEALMDRDKNFSSKRGWQHAIGELFHHGLMLRDFEEHKAHRGIMQAAFRADAVRQYAEMMNPLIESGIDRWQERLESGSGSQSAFLFYPAIKQLTLDLAAAVFLGVPLGREADQLNQAFVDSVAASIALVKKEIPFLSYRRGMNGRRLLERFFGELVVERRDSDGRDMFSQLCRAESETGERFTDREIVDHMIFLMMAAHDTTTSSLTTSIWSLAQFPEWQERVRQESTALDSQWLAYEDRDRLDAADWVFREALRLYPPVPFIGRRTVRDCTVGGLEVPANSGVNICSLVTHFLPEIWTDPQRFDPERFSPERAEHKKHSHAWYPFGGGAHTCLGMHFAYLQVKSFLHQFLQRYRVSLRPGQKVTMVPIPIPKPKEGLPVRLERIA